jgi:CheY-like chemotaxis protein
VEGHRLAKVLLVEDEAVTRLGLTQLLTEEGYSVIATGSAAEALRLIQVQSFDAVITDYKQKGRINGLQILKAFKRFNPVGAELLITGLPPDHLRERTLGAIHVSKPIDLDDFLMKLKTVLT